MLTGSCLCGTVTYVITGPVGPSYYCHCSICRKVSGAGFTANAVVKLPDFAFTSGQSFVKSYLMGENVNREFCSKCGTPIRVTQGSEMRLRMGTIDRGEPAAPSMHIFVGSKANWDSITDSLPAHEAGVQA